MNFVELYLLSWALIGVGCIFSWITCMKISDGNPLGWLWYVPTVLFAAGGWLLQYNLLR